MTTTTLNFKHSWPLFDGEEERLLRETLESRGWWRRDGTQCKAFECEFARFHDSEYGLAVNNGTQALEVLLAACGIGVGDEVIIPALTFVSTMSAVLARNATPVLVDVDPFSLCIDPVKVKAALTPNTKAIVPVHFAGHPADMDALIELAGPRGIKIFEDAAHAHGTFWRDRRVGALHTAGFFSFQQAKLMTAGEGGIIVTNDRDVFDACLMAANCGRPESDRAYQHTTIGTNARMSEFQAAVLRAQLRRYPEQYALRHKNAKKLYQFLDTSKYLEVVGGRVLPHERAHYNVPLRLRDTFADRATNTAVISALNAVGIPAVIPFRPLNKLPLVLNDGASSSWAASNSQDPLKYVRGEFPVAEHFFRTSLCLPHPVLLHDNQAQVAEVIESALRDVYG